MITMMVMKALNNILMLWPVVRRGHKNMEKHKIMQIIRGDEIKKFNLFQMSFVINKMRSKIIYTKFMECLQ
jgi:hypothetical protein